MERIDDERLAELIACDDELVKRFADGPDAMRDAGRAFRELRRWRKVEAVLRPYVESQADMGPYALAKKCLRLIDHPTPGQGE